MPQTCCALKCGHKSGHGQCKLKRFPRDESRAKLWIAMLKRPNFVRKEHHRICECHFDEAQLENGRLRADAVPLLFPTHSIRPDDPNSRNKDPPPRRNMKRKITTSSAEPISLLTAFKRSRISQGTIITVSPQTRDESEDIITNSEISSTVTKEVTSNFENGNVESVDIISNGEMPSKVTKEVTNNLENGNVHSTDEPHPLTSSRPELLEHSYAATIADPICTRTRMQLNPLLGYTVEFIREENGTEKKRVNRNNSHAVKANLNSSLPVIVEETNEMMIARLQKEIATLKEQKHDMQKENWRIKKKLLSLTKMTEKFNDDEKSCLKGGSVQLWSKETLKKSLQTRFAVGKDGYEFLINKGYPLPKYSTLQKHIQNMSLEKGVCRKIMYLLKHKGASMKPPDRNCVISLVEMRIKEKIYLNLSQDKILGNSTLGDTSKVASKLLLLIARGITSTWKQVIGWHLISSEAPPATELWEFVLEGIESLEQANYPVHALVNDMEAMNQGVWSAALNDSRQLQPINYDENPGMCLITHPTRSSDQFYFFADSSHLLKNIKSIFLTSDFHLPPKVLEEQKLPNVVVSSKWIYKKVKISEDKETLQLASYLTKDLLSPASYEALRVGLPSAIFSEKVATALETAILRNEITEDAKPTIWFIRKVNKWHSMMSANRLAQAMTRKNFLEKRKAIDNYTELFQSLTTDDSRWECFKTYISLTNQSFLTLGEKLLFKREINHYLGSRDDAERNFCQLRQRKISGLPVLEALRAVFNRSNSPSSLLHAVQSRFFWKFF